jgi:hypothetical protein
LAEGEINDVRQQPLLSTWPKWRDFRYQSWSHGTLLPSRKAPPLGSLPLTYSPPQEAQVNAFTGGWNIDNTTRLIYANGGYDPWREASVSSDLRPSGQLESTAQVPVNIVPGGFHTSDLVTENGEVNESCKKVIDAEVAQLVEWVREWPRGNGGGPKHHGWPPKGGKGRDLRA